MWGRTAPIPQTPPLSFISMSMVTRYKGIMTLTNTLPSLHTPPSPFPLASLTPIYQTPRLSSQVMVTSRYKGPPLLLLLRSAS